MTVPRRARGFAVRAPAAVRTPDGPEPRRGRRVVGKHVHDFDAGQAFAAGFTGRTHPCGRHPSASPRAAAIPRSDQVAAGKPRRGRMVVVVLGHGREGGTGTGEEHRGGVRALAPAAPGDVRRLRCAVTWRRGAAWVGGHARSGAEGLPRHAPTRGGGPRRPVRGPGRRRTPGRGRGQQAGGSIRRERRCRQGRGRRRGALDTANARAWSRSAGGRGRGCGVPGERRRRWRVCHRCSAQAWSRSTLCDRYITRQVVFLMSWRTHEIYVRVRIYLSRTATIHGGAATASPPARRRAPKAQAAADAEVRGRDPCTTAAGRSAAADTWCDRPRLRCGHAPRELTPHLADRPRPRVPHVPCHLRLPSAGPDA